MLKDFTKITCDLCHTIANRKNCELYNEGCMQRNEWTIDQLIKLGWTKKTEEK